MGRFQHVHLERRAAVLAFPLQGATDPVGRLSRRCLFTFLPRSAPPMYIHGGGFCTGDSSTVFLGHAKYLADRGVCFVSIDYRLLPHASFREQREDWLDAYVWVKAILPKLLPSVDSSRVILLGGSAGGTAVLFLALDANTRGLEPPQAIYSVYPAVDWDSIWSDRPTMDYRDIGQLVDRQDEETQRRLHKFLQGPVETGYDFLGRWDVREGDARWCWYLMAAQTQFLFSCLLRHPGPPFPPAESFLPSVTSDFPPTVFIKAMRDAALDPEQTSLGYRRLKELGVDTILIEANGMLHGDAEGENDMPEHPPREAYFWQEVFNVGLDWCIEKLGVEAGLYRETPLALPNDTAEVAA